MKTLNNYINEALIKKNTKVKTWNYFPKDKEELRSLIEQLLEERGEDANLNDIDTSDIIDMYELFYRLDPHNIDISDWDVSNVEDMHEMFYGCRNFNCDLNKWKVKKVKNMSDMFAYCKCFKGEGLENWDVRKVKNMNCMFLGCENFNSDLSKWAVSNVTTKKGTFTGTTTLTNKPDWLYK